MTHEESPVEGKHGWDNEKGVYNCSDGAHNSWWISIANTPEWQAWYKHASQNMLYDVDECQECGWMSEAHARDFMEFTKQETLRTYKEELRGKVMEIKKGYDNYVADDAFHEVLSLLNNNEQHEK